MKTQIGEVEKSLLDKGYDVFVEYERDETRKPLSCTAYIFNPEVNEEMLGRVVGEGTSYCHPKDNFWKKKGRHMAVCRAAKDAGLL